MQDYIKIGKVSQIDAKAHTAHVIFSDAQGAVVGPLIVLQTAGTWMPEISEDVACILIPGGEGDGFVVGRF